MVSSPFSSVELLCTHMADREEERIEDGSGAQFNLLLLQWVNLLLFSSAAFPSCQVLLQSCAGPGNVRVWVEDSPQSTALSLSLPISNCATRAQSCAFPFVASKVKQSQAQIELLFASFVSRLTFYCHSLDPCCIAYTYPIVTGGQE